MLFERQEDKFVSFLSNFSLVLGGQPVALELVGKQYKLLDVRFWGDLDSRHSSLLSVSTVMIAVTCHVVMETHWWPTRESHDSQDLVSSSLIVRTIHVKVIKWRRWNWEIISARFVKILITFRAYENDKRNYEKFDRTKVKLFLNFINTPFIYLFIPWIGFWLVYWEIWRQTLLWPLGNVTCDVLN